MKSDQILRSQRYIALADAFLPPKAGSPVDLHLAYSRLFLGPGRPVVYLYESVYREGQMMGAAGLQVADCYAMAGLEGSITNNQIPDHLSNELAYMAKLAEREEADQKHSERWRDLQRQFLNEHLSCWLPQFFDQIEKSQAHPFYLRAADSLRELFTEDTQNFNLPFNENGLHGLKGARSQPSAQTVLPNNSVRNQSPRYPNIYLVVNALTCTLCTLCSDICRSRALSIAPSPRTLSLVFDPKTCNGCRACYRICPEQAISIDRGPPRSLPTTRSCSVVANAERVICPSCHQPHISTSWLARLAERMNGDEFICRSLAYCPYCKSSVATNTWQDKNTFDNA